MNTLLTDLSAGLPKTPYQSYMLEHGIERIQLKIPVKQVQLFEEGFSALPVRTKAAIIELVASVGGKIKG